MARYSLQFKVAAFLLIVAMLLGGGGSRFAFAEMLVQLAAIPALVLGLGDMRAAQNWAGFRTLIVICAAAAALVLLQLVPLPPFIWQALPGRELWAEGANLIPGGATWLAWSVNPELTVQSGLSLMVPVAMILSVMRLGEKEQRLLLYIALAMLGVHLAVAVMQALSGGESFYPYKTSHKGLPLGLFANRNHMAELALMGIFVLIGLVSSKHGEGERGGRYLLLGTAILILSLAIVATNSRTATALLIPAYMFLTYKALPVRWRKQSAWILGGLSFSVAGLLAVMLSSGTFMLANTMAKRYAQDEDHRFEFWPDAWHAMLEYMPFGSGLGTFDTVFRANEKLTTVGSHYVNNAHNDYLELGIETGIFGLAIAAVFLFWFGKTLVILSRGQKTGSNIMGTYSGAALVAIALHSMIDYPLRSLSLAAVAALLVGVMAFCRGASQVLPEHNPRRSNGD